jgi:hypothetical protein
MDCPAAAILQISCHKFLKLVREKLKMCAQWKCNGRRARSMKFTLYVARVMHAKLTMKTLTTRFALSFLKMSASTTQGDELCRAPS